VFCLTGNLDSDVKIVTLLVEIFGYEIRYVTDLGMYKPKYQGEKKESVFCNEYGPLVE
jgi:hypothetical protein